MRIRVSWLEWLFSLGTALVGISLVWAATSKYGAGVSSDSIYFITGRIVPPAPYEPRNGPPRLAYLRQTYAGRPEEERAYLIWFDSSEKAKRYIYAPRDLRLVAMVNKVFQNGEGKIFMINPKQRISK